MHLYVKIVLQEYLLGAMRTIIFARSREDGKIVRIVYELIKFVSYNVHVYYRNNV